MSLTLGYYSLAPGEVWRVSGSVFGKWGARVIMGLAEVRGPEGIVSYGTILESELSGKGREHSTFPETQLGHPQPQL